MTIMKLKLNMPFEDLTYMFPFILYQRTSLAWMIVIDARLQPFTKWPDREALWRIMLQCFQQAFGKKVTVIIDCFEIFIDRPSNLLACAQTFASYKHPKTAKVLIGITLQGSLICFKSLGREGFRQVCDRELRYLVILSWQIGDLPSKNPSFSNMRSWQFPPLPMVRTNWIQLTLKKQGALLMYVYMSNGPLVLFKESTAF